MEKTLDNFGPSTWNPNLEGYPSTGTDNTYHFQLDFTQPLLGVRSESSRLAGWGIDEEPLIYVEMVRSEGESIWEFKIRDFIPGEEISQLAKCVVMEGKSPGSYIEFRNCQGKDSRVEKSWLEWPKVTNPGDRYDWIFPHLESPRLISN